VYVYFLAANLITSISFASISLIAAQTYCIASGMVKIPFLIEYGGMVAIEEQHLGVFVTVFLLGNLAIRFIMNRYPLRIYKSHNDYTAILEGNVPLTKRQFQFKKGDVEPVVARDTPILPWNESLHKVKNKKLILLDDYFKTHSELYQMMDQDESKAPPRKKTKPDDDIYFDAFAPKNKKPQND
jgi:hypothetical protein